MVKYPVGLYESIKRQAIDNGGIFDTRKYRYRFESGYLHRLPSTLVGKECGFDWEFVYSDDFFIVI